MNRGRFTIDPNPPVAGAPVKVTYTGTGDKVEWSVDGGEAQKKDVPPATFTIDPLPDGAILFLTDPKVDVGSVESFLIDRTLRSDRK